MTSRSPVEPQAPAIWLRLAPDPRSGTGGAVPWHGYCVAGRTVLADHPLANWPAIRRDAMPTISAGATVPAADVASRVVYDGPGWLGGVQRRVISRVGDGGYQLEVGDVGTFLVTMDGLTAACVAVDATATPDLVEEAATGIAMVLALALQGVFCFHAGAVLAGDAVFAVLGESGSGKSTLTGWLSDPSSSGWQLVADDVLAVEVVGREACVRPDYPQPRLTLDDQPGHSMSPRLRLGVVGVLDTFDHTGADAPAAPVVVARCPSAAAAVHALALHTLALKLFDRPLVDSHVALCADVVREVGVLTLRYPRVRDALPEVASIVADRLPERL